MSWADAPLSSSLPPKTAPAPLIPISGNGAAEKAGNFPKHLPSPRLPAGHLIPLVDCSKTCPLLSCPIAMAPTQASSPLARFRQEPPEGSPCFQLCPQTHRSQCSPAHAHSSPQPPFHVLITAGTPSCLRFPKRTSPSSLGLAVCCSLSLGGTPPPTLCMNICCWPSVPVPPTAWASLQLGGPCEELWPMH